MGIDEPDIVKTDGKKIYFSQSFSFWIEPIFRGGFMPPQKTGETKIIKDFPAEDLKIDGKIKERGNLLLIKDVLIIFSDNKILAYDVSNPQSPKEKWEVKYVKKFNLYHLFLSGKHY